MNALNASLTHEQGGFLNKFLLNEHCNRNKLKCMNLRSVLYMRLN